MATELKKNDPAMARQFFADKLAFTTGPVEVSRNLKQRAEATEFVVIDVREAKDYREGHVPGAINLPRDKWSTLEGLRKDALNILYCYSQQCHLGATAALEFSGKGYSVMEMEGGFKAWKENDLEIQSAQTKQSGRISVAA
jgi:rhodanese-related sulfurtransferase